MVYYSVVTKKELLSKPGFRDAERQAILAELRRCRIIKLSEAITVGYSELRGRYLSLAKEDALIAACALSRNMPLITRNKRHFQVVKGLTILGG